METIEAANREALQRMLAGTPILKDVVPAASAIPALKDRMILHAGPPITWDRMCGPMRGAIMGIAVFEGWGTDLETAAVMAADGQMDPADLPSVVEPLISGQADYVKGDRLSWPSARRAMPWQRWLGNWLFTALTRRALGLDVRDSQCGYVAMSRHTIQTLDWDRLWKSYGYPNDLLAALRAHGLRAHEVPVRPVYGSERSGIRIRHVLLAIPFVLARAWFRRITRRRGLAHSPSPG